MIGETLGERGERTDRSRYGETKKANKTRHGGFHQGKKKSKNTCGVSFFRQHMTKRPGMVRNQHCDLPKLGRKAPGKGVSPESRHRSIDSSKYRAKAHG
jgi:hypothetical protein